jgi:hypothetical protein
VSSRLILANTWHSTTLTWRGSNRSSRFSASSSARRSSTQRSEAATVPSSATWATPPPRSLPGARLRSRSARAASRERQRRRNGRDRARRCAPGQAEGKLRGPAPWCCVCVPGALASELTMGHPLQLAVHEGQELVRCVPLAHRHLSKQLGDCRLSQTSFVVSREPVRDTAALSRFTD